MDVLDSIRRETDGLVLEAVELRDDLMVLQAHLEQLNAAIGERRDAVIEAGLNDVLDAVLQVAHLLDCGDRKAASSALSAACDRLSDLRAEG